MSRSEPISRSFSADQLRAALGDIGEPARPDYLTAIVAQAARTRQRPGWTSTGWWLPLAMSRRADGRLAVLFATLVLLALLAAASILSGSQRTRPVDLGIFEPVAGRIVYGSEHRVSGIEDGIWGLDPASSDPATAVQLTSEPGVPLGWSADGRRLLIQRGMDTLFVLDADGSETLVTEQPWGLKGATISPDGSRVAFGGLTQPESEYGGLFAVDADGGPAELLWEWPEPSRSLIVRFPTFSPDGTQIAFVLDNIDTKHSVWLINADGRDAHQIWAAEDGGFGPGHVRGLAWSQAGDRIALALADFGQRDGIYTLAPDGSNLTRLVDTAPSNQVGGNGVYWSPDGSRLAFMSGCNGENAEGQITGCTFRIVAADGSRRPEPRYGMPGPWHPGRTSERVVSTVAPAVDPRPVTSPSAEPSSATGAMWPQSTLEEVRAAQALADAGDPGYAWQVDRDLGTAGHLGQHHPHDAEIFTRFLEEVLGWEAFLDGHHVPRQGEASLEDGDVVYIRCAPGATNPLYPGDPKGACAPTLDDLRYETVKINVAQLDRQGATGIWVVTGWEMIGPAEQTTPPSDAEITSLMDAFLEARIRGDGAEDFVVIAENDAMGEGGIDRAIPLLYGSSTGIPYQRASFERVAGPVWPEGRMQLKVRLFATNDDTVVEQHFSLERDETGRLVLVYYRQPMEPDGPVPATTEDGEAVPVSYGLLDGALTYRAADPLGPSEDGYNARDRVAIVGLLPDDDAPRRILLMLVDPQPIGSDCVAAPAATDAAALARIIGSDPDFDADDPVAMTIGGMPALRMDVVQRFRASSCPWSEHGTSGKGPILLNHAPFAAMPFFGDRARLWLIDLPEGADARVLALATITDEDSFEPVLEWATPVVDSVEFRTP